MASSQVLYLTPGVFDKGGISRYCRYQLRALRELVDEDQVIALSLLGPGEDDLEVPVAVDWHGQGRNALNRTRFALAALARGLAARPGVIWSAHINFSALALVLARLTGARPILNVYGREVWSRKRASVDWGFTHMPHVVADCHATAQYVKDESAWRGSRLDVSWDCVDTEAFSPGPADERIVARYGLDPGETRLKVLMLGRISTTARHKGWDRLLEVAARLQPDGQFQFILAGDGDYRPALEAAVAERDLKPSVSFTGSVDEHDLVHIYRYCDVFSLISDRGEGRGEGIPLTPLEAAACAKPILVGNQDGSREAVVENENGFVLDPFDLDAHCAALRSLAANEALRLQMSAAAREGIEQRHAYEVFRDQHAQLLQP